MGYSITIGNATPWHEKADGLRSGWSVALEKRDDAPAFADEPTQFENQRWPSYGAWTGSMKALGLNELFFGDEGFFVEHPGCVQITPGHLAIVKAALTRHRETNGGKPAGFFGYDNKTHTEIDNGNDPDLARGVWLEWWMEWALANCETPAIQNS